MLGAHRLVASGHDQIERYAQACSRAARFAEAAEQAGYAEVAVPVLEELGVFERMGEATDVVAKEMYDFEDRDGTRVALRPELTAGVVRAFVQLRDTLVAHKELAKRLDELESRIERKLSSHDQVIAGILDAIRQLMAPPEPEKKRRIGFIHND